MGKGGGASEWIKVGISKRGLDQKKDNVRRKGIQGRGLL